MEVATDLAVEHPSSTRELNQESEVQQPSEYSSGQRADLLGEDPQSSDHNNESSTTIQSEERTSGEGDPSSATPESPTPMRRKFTPKGKKTPLSVGGDPPKDKDKDMKPRPSPK